MQKPGAKCGPLPTYNVFGNEETTELFVLCGKSGERRILATLSGVKWAWSMRRFSSLKLVTITRAAFLG